MTYEPWTSKYKPKSLDEIIGNKLRVAEFDKWIKKFINKEKGILAHTVTISGSHGTGKTLTIELILEKYGYEPFYITSSNIKSFFDKTTKKNKKTIEENPLVQLLIGDDENSVMENNKRALIIADAEKITLKKEIDILISLCKINEQKKISPMIFVTNNQHSKLMTSIKNITLEIKFKHPSSNELLEFVDMICRKEKLKLSDITIRQKIIDYVKCDTSSLLMFLEDLHDIYGDTKREIGMKECSAFVKTSQQKEQSNKLYDCARMLMDDYQGIRKCLDSFEQNNKVLLPLMIYENYPTNLESRPCTNGEYFDQCLAIATTISDADQLSTHIYTEQNWYLQALYGFKTCCETTFMLNQRPIKARSYVLKFSGDVVDASIQSISKKSINSIRTIITNKSLSDILMMKKYIDNLIRLNKLSALKRALVIYNISDENLPIVLTKLLKIDKTVPATKIAGKTKKYIKQIEV